tara:strand:+ start:3803 stop:6199 length:2397 start_codon:yes stop_codon:yes gene_type:complete
MAIRIRGVEQEHEQNQQQLLRDTRTAGQKISDFVTTPEYAAVLLFMCAIVNFLAPAIFEFCTLFGIIFFLICYFRSSNLPFKMPQHSNALDYNDPLPGSNKPRKARGITFFGNDRKTGQELWFSNDDMRTHVLIFGSTGSGKTEFLVSLVYNGLLQGSGFIYIDGKGDNSLFAKIYSMARYVGREDDLLLVNFMTGARDVIGAQKSRLSNTMNPFATGSSSMIAQLVVSLMDSGSGGGDGDMWKGRAITFVEALTKALAYMRDEGHILLDANVIRQYFDLQKLETIVIDKKFPIKERVVDMSDAPEIILEPLYNYVVNLPGYQKAKKHKQGSEVYEQHGFITMQLSRVFTSLSDTYGHIIRTNLAEVDMHDVILNRRILVVLLPALEKSPAELSNLGKLIVASLKSMMASGLGDAVEGTYQDVIERKPTNAPTPYMCVMDEYGYYAVEGFSVVPAQARSLGFSAIFAGQDLPAFQKASKEEAASIGANTNIKICMKLEDPTDTLEFFVKTAGEAYVTTTGGFQTKPTNLTNSYLDTQSAQVEKRNRIELLDLKDQREGEAHIFFKSKIVRASVFYSNPQMAKVLRLNQFLKVETPPDEQLIQIANRIDKFSNTVNNPDILKQRPESDADLDFLIDNLKKMPKDNLLKNAVSILTTYNDKQEAENTAFMDEIMGQKITSGTDIFHSVSMDDIDDPLKLLDIDPLLITPILDKSEMLKNLSLLEEICGKSKAQAKEITSKFINEVSQKTLYPPQDLPLIDKKLILASADRIISLIAPEAPQTSDGSTSGGKDSDNFDDFF